jgi:hypothetical protein
MAGKTGTAQVNYKDKSQLYYASSFVGYFPADKPKYSCIVVVHKPNVAAGYYGADVAGPVFKRIAQKIFTDPPSTNHVKNIDAKVVSQEKSYAEYYKKVENEEITRSSVSNIDTLAYSAQGISSITAIGSQKGLANFKENTHFKLIFDNLITQNTDFMSKQKLFLDMFNCVDIHNLSSDVLLSLISKLLEFHPLVDPQKVVDTWFIYCGLRREIIKDIVQYNVGHSAGNDSVHGKFWCTVIADESLKKRRKEISSHSPDNIRKIVHDVRQGFFCAAKQPCDVFHKQNADCHGDEKKCKIQQQGSCEIDVFEQM